jgi:hypothetical protein
MLYMILMLTCFSDCTPVLYYKTVVNVIYIIYYIYYIYYLDTEEEKNIGYNIANNIHSKMFGH